MLIKNKKALVVNFVIILIILLALLTFIGVLYFSLGGKLPNLFTQIRNLFRFGN